MSRPTEILGADLPQLERIVADLGESRFRARQIYRWIYARRAGGFEEMTDIPLALRSRLAATYRLGRPAAGDRRESADGTRKYLLDLKDGGSVEAVFIPEEKRATFCISPQIGCAIDCRFCHTARMGLTRNLAAGEIAGQVLHLLDDNRDRIGSRPVNIVMMGMGEALHNYDASMAAIRLMADPEGIGIPLRRITLSTAGLVPGILRLAQEPARPKIAVSLNATDDATRTRLMPINRKYPLAVLLDACRRFPLRPRERMTFEYVLLGGVNDTPADPPRLASLLSRHRVRAKVNLIPFNRGAGLPFQEPDPSVVKRFRDALLSIGIPASVRKNRGRDIEAACGQLALESAPHKIL